MNVRLNRLAATQQEVPRHLHFRRLRLRYNPPSGQRFHAYGGLCLANLKRYAESHHFVSGAGSDPTPNCNLNPENGR